MIKVEQTGDLAAYLDGVSKGLSDLSPLSAPMADIVSRGNAEGVGTDVDGNALAPLKASTLKRRKGTGPPLAPQGASSRVVTEAVVNVTGSGDTLNVELSWPTLPWVMFAQSGTKNMPARPIVGIRPSTLAEAQAALMGYWKDITNG